MKTFLGAFALCICFCVLGASQVQAGEKPLVGPVPNWVLAAAEPTGDNAPKSGNVIPLFDEQVSVDHDKVTAYIDVATLITSPEVLNRVGTINYSWQPDHGDITFHRIEFCVEANE